MNEGHVKRTCGSCTKCCEGWITGEVHGRPMRPLAPCIHCTNTGCAIYESRPYDPCRSFNCAWVRPNSPLPDDFRPDKCGAIVVIGRAWKGKPVIYAMAAAEKIPEATLNRLKQVSRRTGCPLLYNTHIVEDGKLVMTTATGFGPPDFVQLVEQHMKPGQAINF